MKKNLKIWKNASKKFVHNTYVDLTLACKCHHVTDVDP